MIVGACSAFCNTAGVRGVKLVLDGHLGPLRVEPPGAAWWWCRRQDLNPQPPAYKADALPLSYAGRPGFLPRRRAGEAQAGAGRAGLARAAVEPGPGSPVAGVAAATCRRPTQFGGSQPWQRTAFGCGRACPIPWARPGTAPAPTSRCSRRMPRRSSSACSTRTAGPRSRASCCPSSRMRSGTATCRTRARASSTATGCTAPTSRTPGHRFNPNKLLIDPYARMLHGDLEWDDALFGYVVGDRAGGPLVRRARQRALHAQVPGDRPRLHLGPRAPGAARRGTRP